MSKTTLMIAACLFLAKTGTGQTTAENASTFFSFLVDGSGWWKAENEDFNEQSEGALTHFLLHFESPDSLSIRAGIYGVNAQRDTQLIWQVWEFYAPGKKAAVMVQRSPYGIYTVAEANYPDARDRHCEMVFQYPDGQALRHRDRHRAIATNQMVTESYDYDEAKQAWIPVSNVTWIRQHP